VERVTAGDGTAGAIHAERRAEQCLFDVMHGDGVAAEERTDVAVLDEPGDDVTAAAVQHCRTDDPDDVSAAFPLLSQQLGHARVVDGLLARDLAAHELELATALRAAEKTGRVDEDAFAAILGVADRDRLTFPDVTALGDAQAI